jgi:hypothetical protein
MLLVHMDVLHEPFLLEGCAELVFLALQLEFTDLLFSDEFFGIFNHSSNIRV